MTEPEQFAFREYAALLRGVPPAWASGWGEDKQGAFVEVEVRNVVQRLRWIPPGCFMMGSPEIEPDRWEGEGPQHEVRLTQGFWLADTACTQELWDAVMGNNTSRFKSPDRPVEQVRWHYVQRFIDKLNDMVPGGDFRLPTEAEWEYACRAGTTTPFWFGHNITTYQVNFNGNYPYNRAEKGQYRKETVSVKSLPPNVWGLYQMHGNVREWCEDWYGPYTSEAQTDPRGPQRGEFRVNRGGSWYDSARGVRSEYRSRYSMNVRGGSIGFRLARGQESAPESSSTVLNDV
jgi:formylglycine-generating enzyme required for sulfatase activity